MEPVVPPPPSGCGLSVRYGLMGYRGLTFLESFGNACLDVIYRCFRACLSSHQLSELRSEMPAPAGLGFAGQQVIYAGEENPPARTTTSHTPSALRVLPGTAGDGNVSQCHTGCNPGHAPAAPRETPSKVVYQDPALRAARAAAEYPAMTAVRIGFEDGPEAEDITQNTRISSIYHHYSNIANTARPHNHTSTTIPERRSRAPPGICWTHCDVRIRTVGVTKLCTNVKSYTS